MEHTGHRAAETLERGLGRRGFLRVAFAVSAAAGAAGTAGCSHAPTVGARTVVATSDRDSFALIGEHTKMLRILNGGVDASPLLDPHQPAPEQNALEPADGGFDFGQLGHSDAMARSAASR